MMRREKEKEKEEGKAARRSSSVSSSSSSASAAVAATAAPFAPFSRGDAAAAAAAAENSDASASTSTKEQEEHEFTTAQEQVFRLLVRSLHVLCYARLAHAGCEALVALASAAAGDAVGALAAGVGALEVAATAKLFHSASSAFDRVISSSGNDIKLLLSGVASAPGSHGLAAMFEKLCHVLELALFLKIAPLAVVGVARVLSYLVAGNFSGGGGGRSLPAELLGSWSVDALREFAAGVGVA